MSAQPYRRIPDLLRHRVDFEGSSMSAYHEDGGDYVVLSYATAIARVRADGSAVYNERRFSPTTSRHQSLVRAWLLPEGHEVVSEGVGTRLREPLFVAGRGA